MLPDLTIFLALMFGMAALEGAPADPLRALLGSLAALVAGGALSRMAAGRGQRAAAEGELLLAEASARWTAVWPLLGWLVALQAFDFGALVSAHVPRETWLGPYLALLVPMLAVFAVGWKARAEVEAMIVSKRGGVPLPATTAAVLARGLRRNGIVIVPLLVILGLVEGVWLAGQLGVEPLRVASQWLEAMPLLEIGMMFVIVVCAMPFIPRIFARALKAEPLAPGALRDVLERAAQAIGLRYRDILVWRTGGRVLNAMVVGFTARSRTIFLTDGLLQTLPEEEVLAVFFHEAGHAKRNHLWLFFVTFFSLSLLFYSLRVPFAQIGVPPELLVVLHLLVLWFGLLGWVSRRFERESDIYGAEHAAVLDPDAPGLPVPGLPTPLPRGATMMVRALDRIRQVMGYSGSHRHGSVEDRMAYVTHYAIDPSVRAAFQRSMRGLKLGILTLVLTAVAVTALDLPAEIARAQARIGTADAHALYDASWALAHSTSASEVDAAPAAWRRAYDAFVAAAAALGDRSDLESQQLRVRLLWGAADTALHGLRDRTLAKGHLEALLGALDASQLPATYAASFRFHAHIDLGRLAAWDYADLPPGDPLRVLDAMQAHRAIAAEQRRVMTSEDGLPATVATEIAERTRLLIATIEAARGEHAIARKSLESLASLADGRPTAQVDSLVELAEDARLELQRLTRAEAAATQEGG